MSENTPDHVSLTPAAFHIIIALAGAARHGYAIMKAVEDETEGHVVLGPGTLYRSIKQLLETGLIEDKHRVSELIHFCGQYILRGAPEVVAAKQPRMPSPAQAP